MVTLSPAFAVTTPDTPVLPRTLHAMSAEVTLVTGALVPGSRTAARPEAARSTLLTQTYCIVVWRFWRTGVARELAPERSSRKRGAVGKCILVDSGTANLERARGGGGQWGGTMGYICIDILFYLYDSKKWGNARAESVRIMCRILPGLCG